MGIGAWLGGQIARRVAQGFSDRERGRRNRSNIRAQSDALLAERDRLRRAVEGLEAQIADYSRNVSAPLSTPRGRYLKYLRGSRGKR